MGIAPPTTPEPSEKGITGIFSSFANFNIEDICSVLSGHTIKSGKAAIFPSSVQLSVKRVVSLL